MNPSNLSRTLLLCICIIALALVAQPALAAGISVNPSSGGFDTVFDVHADGFQPGEPVSLWVGLPTLAAVGLGEETADSGGAIAFSIQPDASWPAGEFIAVAHGQRSGLEYSAKFFVGVPAPNGDGAEPGADQRAPVTMHFLGDPGGLAFNVNAGGFAGDEIVMAWYKDPAADTHPLPNVEADPWGSLVFVFSGTPDSLYGPYLITLKGLTSGKLAYNTVTLWGGFRDLKSSDPISIATPMYHVTGTGFSSGEAVSVWVVFPTGTKQLVKQVTSVDGSLDYNLIVRPGWALGDYGVEAYGANTGKTLTFHFKYDGNVTPLP